MDGTTARHCASIEGALKTILRTTGSGVKKLIDMTEPTVDRYDERGEHRYRERSRHDDGRRSRDRSRSSQDKDPVGTGDMNRHEVLGVAALMGSRGSRRDRVDDEVEWNRSKK
jgi:hypothetical protein